MTGFPASASCRYPGLVRIPAYLARSTRASRLLLMALVWTAVGTGLAIAGTRWLFAAPSRPTWAWLGIAAVAGWAKGRFLLRPRAAANAARIAATDDHRPLSEVFTPGTWGLAFGMMAAGYAVRHAGLPRALLGGLYAAVGTGLLTGSSACWSAWARDGRALGESGRKEPP